MNYEFKRHRIDKLSREKALEALEMAARLFGFNEFGKREFDNAHVGVSASGIRNAFGSWAAGMEELRSHLYKQNIELKRRSSFFISDEELFSEMERVWVNLKHRPSRYEWEYSSPIFSYGTFKRRFGGWQAACLKFIEYQMGGSVELKTASGEPTLERPSEEQTSSKDHLGRKRDPSARLRLQVLDRDGYRCVLCGRSPAEDRSVKLHIDHIKPFSASGETTLDNLQTLCSDCNLGKSDSQKLGILSA